MCNIAGYAGNRPAAPILLEMLRRQAPFDGDMSTGVATVFEGKLYYRKIVGDVDRLIAETDVLSLPGTIGIAHTRPGGNPAEGAFHPFLSMDETIAVVTNGTTPTTRYCVEWDRAVDMLYENGFVFRHQNKNPKGKSPKLSLNGDNVSPAEARCYLIDYYLKQNHSVTEAVALACSHMYSDNATVMLSEKFPDRIFALRTTRPLVAKICKGETFLATTRFAFPDLEGRDAFDLPLFYTCEISRGSLRISEDRLQGEEVSPITPYTYSEGYRRMEALLQGERAPLYFDELEFAVRDDFSDLFDGNHTCLQHARLVYDLLYRFEEEGRLKKELRVQERKTGIRHRYYFSLEA
ncbi:MAG: hypothetical protein IKD31_00745 [Clostridia bacterium]|nr:hypothetical protein [Clostridia bacterium]